MSSSKIGAVNAWALAAGGMVGGGIYISLATVIEAAGSWAWLSFLIAGITAVCTALSYAGLTNRFSESGGAFDFLERIDRQRWAGHLGWLLAIGYVFTISVYAFAFGNYVSHAFGWGTWGTKLLIPGIVAVMIWLNLAGAGKLTKVETTIVTLNLAILIALAVVGVSDWRPAQLSAGIEAKSINHALFGAAAIFVAYEGFQLLTYDYDDLDGPKRWFKPVLGSAAVFVVGVYVLVALGATMIAGAGGITAHEGVSLSYAAQQRFGVPGLAGMTVAAAFATSAAINSTLFSTAKLMRRISQDGELPRWFRQENDNQVPGRAVISIGALAGGLALLGSLATLVEAASLIFLAAFVTVNALALDKLGKARPSAWLGLGLCGVLGVYLVIRLAQQHLGYLLAIVGLVVAVLVTRHFFFADGSGKGDEKENGEGGMGNG